jgi:transposase
MMGERRSGQDALFYEFSLERHVPVEHLLRSVDRLVDLDGVRYALAPFYSEIGRPSIDPELMIRMLIVGYCLGIRSERRLFEEVHLNLAYRWFCRLGLDGTVPDHSTFSKNRHGRFRDSDLLRKVFETTVERCVAEGLVGGEGFAVDASMIKADASRQRCVPGSEWQAPEAANHAVREYLAVLDDAAFGAATEVVPKFVSPADSLPAGCHARRCVAAGGRAARRQAPGKSVIWRRVTGTWALPSAYHIVPGCSPELTNVSVVLSDNPSPFFSLDVGVNFCKYFDITRQPTRCQPLIKVSGSVQVWRDLLHRFPAPGPGGGSRAKVYSY